MFIKKYGFEVISQSAPITPIYLMVGTNLEDYRKKYPQLLNVDNIKKASERFGSKKKNLVLIEGPLDISWKFNKKVYHLHVETAVMCDGASTPIRVGDIDNFGPQVNRAFFIHDLLYGLFKEVSRRDSDKIYTCFLEVDGCVQAARGIMYLALRMFGRRVWRDDPKKHWNYHRATLTIDDKRTEY